MGWGILLLFFQVLELDGNEVFMRYLRRQGNIYSWPLVNDESWQPTNDILCVVPYPDLANNRGQLQFADETLETVKSKALSTPGIQTVYLK